MKFITKPLKGPLTTLDDLIDILDIPNETKVSSNQKDLVFSLKELNNLIGLKSFKEILINQILFFIQDLMSPETFLNAVISGPPGVGKTTVINILAKIYQALGLLTKNTVIKVSRADLIADFLGQTAIKTKKVLNLASGGILLIDEAYSLGSGDGDDSYSKECIDTINEYLSLNVSNLICIIAGYENEIEKCFFKQNSGLKRRFPWKFNIDNYNPEELSLIFRKQLGDSKIQWSLIDDGLLDLFKKNIEKFDGNGGDTKNLLDRCKICYARRNFLISNEKPKKKQRIEEPLLKILTMEDINDGFSIFLTQKIKSIKKCAYCKDQEEQLDCSRCLLKKEKINLWSI